MKELIIILFMSISTVMFSQQNMLSVLETTTEYQSDTDYTISALVNYYPSKELKGYGISIIAHHKDDRGLYVDYSKGRERFTPVDVYTISIGSQIYKYHNNYSYLAITYNEITNKNRLDQEVYDMWNNSLKKISAKLIGVVNFPNNILVSMQISAFNWGGGFGIGYKF